MLLLCFFAQSVFAQVEIDKTILLTGADGQRIIKNLENPEEDTDAANKAYVDESVSGAGGIPAGVIVMWSGSVETIPAGWALCNGSNGTPDLRDRFVAGAGNTYTPGQSGGASQITLTVAQLPAHTHNFAAGIGNTNPFGDGVPMTSSSNSGAVTKTTASAGSGSPVNILPPYYALAYIMKL